MQGGCALSSLALVYSTAEYCAPLWAHSLHVSGVNTQLNYSMSMVSCTVRSTRMPKLLVLSNIVPPVLLRKQITFREIIKLERNPQLPGYHDIFTPPPLRLPTRNVLWRELVLSSPHPTLTEDWTSLRMRQTCQMST